MVVVCVPLLLCFSSYVLPLELNLLEVRMGEEGYRAAVKSIMDTAKVRNKIREDA